MGRLFFWLQLPLFLFHVNPSIAQDYPRATYDWEKNRKITYQPSDSELKMPAVIILDSRFVDYTLADRSVAQTGIPTYSVTQAYDPKTKTISNPLDPNGPVIDPKTNEKIRHIYHYQQYRELYYTVHRIIRVNDDRGINQYDKIYIHLNDGDKIIKLKARTINADGSIVELSKDEFKDISNYENYGDFKVFAMENVEKGSEVEFLFTVCRKQVGGGMESFQGDYPIKHASLSITAPSAMIIATKTFNGFPEPTHEIKHDRVYIKALLENVPPLIKEPYVMGNPNLMKLSYRLLASLKDSNKNAWVNICKWYSENIVNELSYVDLSPYIKKWNLREKSPGIQIQAIETFIKDSIKLIPSTGDEIFSTPAEVLVNKSGTVTGILRLYKAFFIELHIPFNIVLTSNLSQTKFDPEYAVYEDFQEQLLYFPLSKKFIAPFHKGYHYGFPPISVAFNLGLFIDSIGEGRIALIKGMDIDNTYEVLKADVTLNPDKNSANVDEQFKCSGYRAAELIGNYEQADSIEKNRLIEKFDKRQDINKKKIISQEVSIKVVDTTGVKNLSVNTRYESNTLIQKAGKDYLMNIGIIINQSRHIEKEENRINDVDIAYPIKYYRMIEIKIPDGYTIKGLDDLKIDRAVMDNGNNRLCSFISTYSLNDNILDINITEFYHRVYYPKEQYHDFCQVINAAGDFSKLQIVLEKE